MKPLRKLTGFIAAAAFALAAFGQQAAAADLKNHPLIQDALNRANFEPGGKYHLFGSRGTVAERTGLMTISPTVTQQIGNLQIQQATIFSNPGYIVRFSGHGHEVHAPFDNHASRSASAKGGSVLDGFTMFSMSWDGYEHHPADGYDGPQGGGYPAPQGARDIYAYVVKGKAQSIKLNPTDTRSTEQRFADRFGNIPKNFSDRAAEAHKKILEYNPNRNLWGNGMEFINGIATGAVNPFLSVGEAIGVGDAAQGIGFARDAAALGAIGGMRADTAMDAIDGLGYLKDKKQQIGKAVQDWTAENPNAAETVEAALNVAAAAKVAKLAKTGTGKAAVSDNFADAHRAGRSQTATVANSQVGIEWGKGIGKQGMPWENYVGQSLPADARLPKNFKTFDYFDINSGKAISAKTLDTQTASRLANPKQVYNTMKQQVDAAVRFDQHTLSGIELNSTMIKQREIQIAVPAQTNAAQRAEIQRAVEYGKNRNVDVIVTEIR